MASTIEAGVGKADLLKTITVLVIPSRWIGKPSVPDFGQARCHSFGAAFLFGADTHTGEVNHPAAQQPNTSRSRCGTGSVRSFGRLRVPFRTTT